MTLDCVLLQDLSHLLLVVVREIEDSGREGDTERGLAPCGHAQGEG